MRVLITGASGFVGRHLSAVLREAGDEVVEAGGPLDGDAMLPVDLSDGQSLRAAIDIAQPEVIFHLAAQAAPAEAIASPLETYETNILGTARLLEAARGSGARIVFASSADVYGPRDAREFPLRETLTPRPANPYGASKAAAEAICLGEASSYNLDVVIVRSFNLIGPGQSDHFVVSAFASQLARIADGAPPQLSVGNLDARRDFLDVRDAVAGYAALARSAQAGEIYNLCSGSAVAIRDILGELIRVAHVPVEIVEDPGRMRPSDTPLYYGSNEKLRTATGWEPHIPLQRSLRDAYEDARGRSRIPAS